MIWNHLQDFDHPIQKIPPEGSQRLWAEQNFLIHFRDIFQSYEFMASGTAHDTCYNAHFQSGAEQPEMRIGTKKRKLDWGFLKPSKIWKI